MSLAEISALLGSVLPSIVSVVNQPKWPSWARALMVVLVSVAAGAVTAAVRGDFTGKTWLESAGVAFGAALAAYHLWWKPSGITTAIENATSPK